MASSSFGNHVHIVHAPMPKATLKAVKRIQAMDLDWRLTLEEGLEEVDENDIQTSGSIGWYWKWGWDNALDGKSNAMKTVSIDDHKAAAYLRGYHDGLEYLLTKASLQE